MDDNIELEELKPEKKCEVDESVYKFHQRYYLTIKCVIVSLIGFGTRLKNCLRNDDDYRTFMSNHRIFWCFYLNFCFLIVHLSLVANILTLIYVYFYGERRLQSYSLSTIMIICNITAIFAIDASLTHKKLRSKLINDICDENFIFDSSKDEENVGGGGTCFSHAFNIFIHSSCLTVLESAEHSRATFLIITFTIPLICHIWFIVSITFKIIESKWIYIERSFFHFNLILILFTMLQYMIICLILRLKFVGLNHFIRKLISYKRTTLDQLEIIIKWYKHNFNQVQNFDEINNIFILLCFILNCSLIAYIIYELILNFHWIDITDILLVMLLLPITVITFKIGSDVDKIATITKKLIEEYMLCNDLKNNSLQFNSSCQSFFAVLLSKPVNLTFLGFKSISVTTIIFFLFFVFTKSTELAGLVDFFKSRDETTPNSLMTPLTNNTNASIII